MRFLPLAALVLVAACSSSGSAGTAPSTTAASRSSDVVWLCRPDQSPNPCTNDRGALVIAADGSTTVEAATATDDPPVDCFYVYPTVSTQTTAVANLEIDEALIAVANAQASRFSEVCRVFAPVYRQRTIAAIGGLAPTEAEAALGPADVLAAWEDYLAHDNDGRGVILIGHSQGTFVLTNLIAEHIDDDPEVRDRLISALLIGGRVVVPPGEDVGGSFQHVPVCRADDQTGCVVAYSAFGEPPPDASLFGVGDDANQVVCTNPAALAGGAATLHPYFPTGSSLLGGITGLPDDQPWVSLPELFRGECRTEGTKSWLQVDDVRGAGDDRPRLVAALGPTWGYHLYDVNVAAGDLVTLAASQAEAWGS